MRELDNDYKKQLKRRWEEINLDMSNLLFIFSLRKSDLVSLKADVDKSYIDKLKNAPSNLSNLKSKVDKLHKWEIPSVTNLATTTDLTVVENKIPNVRNLVKKLTIIQKLMKLKRKLLIMIMINILLLQSLLS